VTLSFNLAPGRSLGQAVDAIKAKEQSVGVPPGLTSSFAGSAKAFQESLATQPFLIFWFLCEETPKDLPMSSWLNLAA